MKKRKHIRKLISLLLVMALMSTCLGVGSVSVSAENRDGPRKRGLCMTGWHKTTNPNDDDYDGFRFYHSVMGMHYAFTHLINEATYNSNDWSEYFMDNGSAPTWSGISVPLGKIAEVFADSQNDDINYLFICGHGSQYANCMNLGGTLYYGGTHYKNGVLQPTLRSTLDAIPGRFVVFISACYSGQAINWNGENNRSANDADEVDSAPTAEQMLDAFFDGVDEETITRSGELASTAKYTVFCSSEASKPSWGFPDGFCFGPYAWARGLGYKMNWSSGVGGSYLTSFPADSANFVDHLGNTYNGVGHGNGDGIVTPEELKNYANEVYVRETNPTIPADQPKPMSGCYSMYPFFTIATEDYPFGDVNMNGDISNQDVLLVQKYLAGLITLNTNQMRLADVNGDGSVTSTDRQYIQYYIAGISLP